MMCASSLARKREITWNSKGSARWDFKLNMKDCDCCLKILDRGWHYITKYLRVNKELSQIINFSLECFHHRKTCSLGIFSPKIFRLDFSLCITKFSMIQILIVSNSLYTNRHKCLFNGFDLVTWYYYNNHPL